MANSNFAGIEEALSVAEGFNIGCDYETAFIFLKKSTQQIFTQIFCEETENPSHYGNADMLYVGRLEKDTNYNDIIEMIERANEQETALEEEASFFEWHDGKN